MLLVLRYLHMLLAFAWFAAVFAALWNTLQARRTDDWARRAALLDVNRGLSAIVALPSLLGVGIVGNLLAIQMGHRMGTTPLFMVANSLWVVVLIVTLAVEMPSAGALGALSHAAADAEARGGEGEPAGWQRELRRWRIANLLQLLLYMLLLALMVAPWGIVG